MYPSLAGLLGRGGRESQPPPPAPAGNAYGAPQQQRPHDARPPPRAPAAAGGVVEASPWTSDCPGVLRVKIADEYRLDPLVTVPPALDAGARGPQQDAFDFDYERGVMAAEGGGLVDKFMAKPEAAYYAGTSAGKYVSMGYSPEAVQLALAYQAQARGDEAQVIDFCNNYTQLLGMGFSPSVAAGALARANNDAAAATDLCLAAAG